MFCPKCGAQNDDNATFCGECGASLAKAPQPQPAPAPQAAPAAAPFNPAPAGNKKPGMLNVKLIAIVAVAVVALIIAAVVIIPNALNGGDAGKLKIDNLLNDNSTRVYNTINGSETAKYSGSTVYVSNKEFAALLKQYNDNDLDYEEFAEEISKLNKECWFYRVLDKKGEELAKSGIKDGKDVSAVNAVAFVVNANMSAEQVAKEVQRFVALDKLAVVSSSSGYYSGAGYGKSTLVEFSCSEMESDVYVISIRAYSLNEYRDIDEELDDLKKELEDLNTSEYKDYYVK